MCISGLRGEDVCSHDDHGKLAFPLESDAMDRLAVVRIRGFSNRSHIHSTIGYVNRLLKFYFPEVDLIKT